MRRGKVRTGSGVQAEVGASELDGSGTAVDDPVLRTSAVTVVAVRDAEGSVPSFVVERE